MITAPLSGIVPPLCTPLRDDGSVDVESLRRVARRMIGAGVDGLFVLGSSGEAAFLTDDQRGTVLRTVVDEVAGRAPVLAGCIETSTLRVIERAKAAEQDGADAIVVTAPFYVRVNTAEVAEHFREVHRRCPLPMFAYDIPVSAGRKLDRGMVLELASEGVLAGVKDSSGDESGLRYLVLGKRDRGLDDFAVLTGSELTVDAALLAGADGAVPGLGNVDPDGYVAVRNHIRAGDVEAARAEQERLLRLFEIIDVADASRIGPSAAALGAFKMGMALLGVIDSATMAAPQLPLTEEEIVRIKNKLDEAGLLS